MYNIIINNCVIVLNLKAMVIGNKQSSVNQINSKENLDFRNFLENEN